MSKSRYVDSEWRSPAANWAHRQVCYDEEGRLECCCGLREPLNLYNQSVAEIGLGDWPEET